MTAPRRPTLSERVDMLMMRVLTLETLAGLDKVEGETLRRIAADRQPEPPAKAPRSNRGAAR